MTNYCDIEFITVGKRAEIWLNRPERLNALTYTTIAEMKEALQTCADTNSIRYVVIRARGRSFCSGDSLKGMGDTSRPMDLYSRYQEEGYVSLLRAIRNLPKPVISAVHGHSLGISCDVMLSCDIRIVSKDAVIGYPFAKIGMSAAGGSYLLPRYVGFTRAIEMLFSCRNISGEEAFQTNMATELVESEADFDAAIERWEQTFNRVSPKSLSLIKRATYRSFENDFENAFELILLDTYRSYESEDRKEGKQAWLEKRDPQFTGR